MVCRRCWSDLSWNALLRPRFTVAVENAVSVAGTLLMAEATLTEVPEDKSETHDAAEAAMMAG